MAGKTDRRCFLARGVLGAAAVGAAHSSIEENILRAAIEDGSAKSCQSKANQPKTSIPPGSLPCGKICDVSLSRLMIGGNLISGSAHSRDLMYTSKLFTSYNNEAKVFETLEIAQACGINAIQINPKCFPLVKKFVSVHGGGWVAGDKARIANLDKYLATAIARSPSIIAIARKPS